MANDPATVHVRNVPLWLKMKFNIHCIKNHLSMNDMIIKIMYEVVGGGDDGQTLHFPLSKRGPKKRMKKREKRGRPGKEARTY
jgi:hypothetical protein